jgi:hypothetical protein
MHKALGSILFFSLSLFFYPLIPLSLSLSFPLSNMKAKQSNSPVWLTDGFKYDG